MRTIELIYRTNLSLLRDSGLIRFSELDDRVLKELAKLGACGKPFIMMLSNDQINGVLAPMIAKQLRVDRPFKLPHRFTHPSMFLSKDPYNEMCLTGNGIILFENLPEWPIKTLQAAGNARDELDRSGTSLYPQIIATIPSDIGDIIHSRILALFGTLEVPIVSLCPKKFAEVEN